jgi:hypothetical protein
MKTKYTPTTQDITASDIARTMAYVRSRHINASCDQHGRVICDRDTVWAQLSPDVVQELLVAFVRSRAIDTQ